MLSVLSTWYERDSVPIGAYKGEGLTHSDPPLSYVADLVNSFPSPIKNSSQVPDAVVTYRKVLAAAPDRSVTISSIGLMTNLEQLLRSGADEVSPLSGLDLVAQKVVLLAAMAGTYPSSALETSNHRRKAARLPECNMCGCYNGADATSAATAAKASEYVYSHMPSSVKIVFSGFEVGLQVHTGARLEHCATEANPCRRAFMDYKRDNPEGWNRHGRCSWDPLTTLIAVRGASASSNGVSECTNCDGVNDVTDGGHNHWVPGPPSNQSYLILNDAQVAADAIDALLCQPRRREAASSLLFAKAHEP